jgi:hypothetical protein
MKASKTHFSDFAEIGGPLRGQVVMLSINTTQFVIFFIVMYVLGIFLFHLLRLYMHYFYFLIYM